MKFKNLESKKKRKLETEITKSDNDSDMVLPIIIMKLIKYITKLLIYIFANKKL